MPRNLKTKSALVRTRITEKAAILAGSKNVYAFEVEKEATKRSVAASVKLAYGVTPRMVHLLAIPKKSVFRRGKWGETKGGKKAYVYLKEGDKIELA